MIKNKVIVNDIKLELDHNQCTDTSSCKNEALYIESTSSENNTLSTITINDNQVIYVYWESHSSAESFETLYVPETDILFIGCGELSARISIKENKLLGLEYLCLFWGFERHDNYILETGELECFLYDLEGNKISSTAVDPPYEIEYKNEGIMFKSIVMGTTWLRYVNS